MWDVMLKVELTQMSTVQLSNCQTMASMGRSVSSFNYIFRAYFMITELDGSDFLLCNRKYFLLLIK